MVLSACQVIPAYQFVRLSQRWYWSYNYIMCDFYYPKYFAFFLKPFVFGSPLDGGGPVKYTGQWGYQEVCTYIGVVPVLLGTAGLWFLRKKPVAWFLAFAVLLFTVLAMADATTVTHYIYLFFFKFVPGFGKNRSVGRIMVLTMLALACLAGLLLTQWENYWIHKKNMALSMRKALGLGIPLALLAVSAVDLYQYDKIHMECYRIEQFFDETMMFSTPACKVIRADTSYPRVSPSSHNDYGIMQKWAQIQSMYPVVVAEAEQYIIAAKDNLESPVPDLINFKYLTNSDLFHKPSDRWKPVIDDVVVNTKTLPRVFVVGGSQLAATTTAAIDMIQNGKMDPRAEVLLEKTPEDNPPGPKGFIAEGKITRYENNRVEMECQNDRPGILFFSDPYFPGWRVWVDGEEKPLLKADGLFRAVVLSKTGPHHIRMDYHPAIIYLSFFISLIAWLALGFGLFYRVSLGKWASRALKKFPGFA
jgi:hypothetical protein